MLIFSQLTDLLLANCNEPSSLRLQANVQANVQATIISALKKVTGKWREHSVIFA